MRHKQEPHWPVSVARSMAVLAGDCRIADYDHDSNELDDNDDDYNGDDDNNNDDKGDDDNDDDDKGDDDSDDESY